MPERPFTLMTVHAHPDDEAIGTGGTMAKAVRDGHRVVLVTGTRGELGEIVVPEMDTPTNQRRLGEIRAGELEDAMVELGVSEWENLGYRDSGMMGAPGNRDPRSFWQADVDEATRRLVWLVRRYRPHVMTTYNEIGGYGHPDHIRVHDVSLRAWDRAGDPAWYAEQLDDETTPWTPLKLYEQAIPASVRDAMRKAIEAAGKTSFWSPPEGLSRREMAEWRARMRRILVPDSRITAWIDVSEALDQKWRAVRRHVTQISDESTFMLLGLEGWRSFWAREAYILRASRVPTTRAETDLFAGLD